jgi:hypothetical protein
MNPLINRNSFSSKQSSIILIYIVYLALTTQLHANISSHISLAETGAWGKESPLWSSPTLTLFIASPKENAWYRATDSEKRSVAPSHAIPWAPKRIVAATLST